LGIPSGECCIETDCSGGPGGTGYYDCNGNVTSDCGCGANASLACTDAGATHQYCDGTQTYCPDVDSDGSSTCTEQAYWNGGDPYCDCAGNAVGSWCNGDGNTCNGSTLDACNNCGIGYADDESNCLAGCKDCMGISVSAVPSHIPIQSLHPAKQFDSSSA
jgi:hypothetical protein